MFSWLRKKRYQVSGSGSPYRVIQSTHITIQDLANTGRLKAGWKYRFAYQTQYKQMVTNIVMLGAIEHLTVTAISSTAIDKVVTSENYPNDYIEYDLYNETVSGSLTGLITRRIDELGNDAPFDSRTILFRRYAVDLAAIPDITDNTNYSVGDLMKTLDAVYQCRIAYNSGGFGDPLSSVNFRISRGYWIKLFFTDNVYISPTTSMSKINGVAIPVDALDYEDYTVFRRDVDSMVKCSNIVIEKVAVTLYAQYYQANVVFHPVSFSILTYYSDINIDGYSQRNTFTCNENGVGSNKTSVRTSNDSIYSGCNQIEVNSATESMLFATIQYSKFYGVAANSSLSDCSYLDVMNIQTSCFMFYCNSLNIQGLLNSFLGTVNNSLNISSVKNSTFYSIDNIKLINIDTIVYTLVLATYIHLENISNKTFNGYNNYMTVISASDTIEVYALDYTNIIANKTSPAGAIWYDITDDTGVSTTNYLQ